MTGPSAAAMPPVAVQARTAPLRRSGEKLASTRLSEVGVSRAAPAACTSRNAISMATLVAAPQAAEAAVKMATPEQEAVLAPVPVGQPAHQDEQRGVDDRVAVEHPGQVAQAAAAQVPRDGGQGHVDDEQVQAGQHDAGADDDQDLARPAARPGPLTLLCHS